MSEALDGLLIRSAEFLFGAPNRRAIKGQSLPEIAIIGRSNVGKSTFINRVCCRRVARVSKTPGCTQELNFYRVAGDLGVDHFEINLVDMPGFGFAKLSKDQREEIAELTVDYITNRPQLRVVLLLADCRREPGEDERAIQRICIDSGRHCLVVATKMDKEKRSQHARLLSGVARGVGLEPADVIATGEGFSPLELWQRSLSLL